MTVERRRSARTTICLDVSWDGRTTKSGARLTDLSATGCYVDTLGEVFVGEQLSLRIEMPNGEQLALQGEVAHYTPRLGFGARFRDLTDNQQQSIDWLLSYGRGQETEPPRRSRHQKLQRRPRIQPPGFHKLRRVR